MLSLVAEKTLNMYPQQICCPKLWRIIRKHQCPCLKQLSETQAAGVISISAENALIKKKIKIFLIYKEIQNGAVAKSYMTNGLLINWLNICTFPQILQEALHHMYMTLQLLHSEFPYKCGQFSFSFFNQCEPRHPRLKQAKLLYFINGIIYSST